MRFSHTKIALHKLLNSLLWQFAPAIEKTAKNIKKDLTLTD